MRGSTKAPTGYAPAMNDLEAIRRVIALYAQLVDDKRFEEWGQLFTEDAVFVAHGRRIEGRARIVESIAAMLGPIQVKHLVASPVVDLVATDRAMAWTDLTSFVRGEAGVGIATIGRYHDELARGADGTWRLARRELVAVGAELPPEVTPSPGPRPPPPRALH
ncbi:MAG: nuclear transport factor 2 family protein [Myxococcales bacterium]|nr:nuclear transport factor 2 family protein [Myxococcales bacterium]